MAKSKKSGKRGQPKKRKRGKSEIPSGQTNQPFEQDIKRRIGEYGGEGEPPLMKK
jgi:hypothetical protein